MQTPRSLTEMKTIY